MNIIFIIVISMFLIIMGLFGLYAKYKVVIGGTICKAEVKRCEFGSSVKGHITYRYIMGFTYDNLYMEKPSLNSTSFPKKAIGKTFKIHYNCKYPNYIVKKSIGLDLLFLSLIGMGVFMMVVTI